MASICSCCWAWRFWAFFPRKYNTAITMAKTARITNVTMRAVFTINLLTISYANDMAYF